MQTNIIPWHNENELTEYPLVKSYGYNGFLVDAQFIQFDNFRPTLKSVKVSNSDVEIVVTLQTSDLLLTIPISSFQDSPFTQQLTYDGYNIGFLSFGLEAYKMLTTEMVNLVTKTLNIPFEPSTIISIPSNSGVFSVNTRYGDLSFAETTEVHFQQSGQEVVTDIYTLPTENTTPYLLTLNSITPNNNRVDIVLPEIIRTTVQGPATLQFNLIGNSSSTALNNIIVTDG